MLGGGNMRHFLYRDRETCEDYIIDANSKEEIKETIETYCLGNPRFICELDDFEYEMSGLDVY